MALSPPAIQVSRQPMGYDGTQLRSHFAYETFGIRGDSVVAWVGPVRVEGEHLVDLADRKDGLFIAGESMLHFIVESFGPSLEGAVFRQRLLVLLLREALGERGVAGLRRRGDDLFVHEGKLSVSIATVSATSSLVHLGINVRQAGTPVATAALEDLGIEPFTFAEALLDRFSNEIRSMQSATWKVRSVP